MPATPRIVSGGPSESRRGRHGDQGRGFEELRDSLRQGPQVGLVEELAVGTGIRCTSGTALAAGRAPLRPSEPIQAVSDLHRDPGWPWHDRRREIHYISRRTIARKSRAFEEHSIFEGAHSGKIGVTHSSCLRTQTNQDIHPTPRSNSPPGVTPVNTTCAFFMPFFFTSA